MTQKELRHRHLKVLEDAKRKRSPSAEYTELMVTYHAYLRHEACDSEEQVYAFELFEDPTRREIVEALLLADASPEDIRNAFGITPAMLEYYQELFFDTARFVTKLDKVSYIETYPDPFGKELKLRAYSLGPQFIFFKYGNIVPETEDQRRLVKKMFMASAYRAMEANFNPITSKVSRAASEWSKNMLKAYEAMERLMGDTDNSGELHKYLMERALEDPDQPLRAIREDDIV